MAYLSARSHPLRTARYQQVSGIGHSKQTEQVGPGAWLPSFDANVRHFFDTLCQKVHVKNGSSCAFILTGGPRVQRRAGAGGVGEGLQRRHHQAGSAGGLRKRGTQGTRMLCAVSMSSRERHTNNIVQCQLVFEVHVELQRDTETRTTIYRAVKEEQGQRHDVSLSRFHR